MFDDRSRKYKNQFVPLEPVDIDAYKPFVDDKVIEELKWLAAPLEDKVWANVNSTFVGGGVAEMLRSIVPLAKGLGIQCRWFVIEGTEEFFSVTKKFHNLLQGVKEDICMTEIFHAYLETIQQNLEVTRVVAHMVVIHDPQPAAAIMSGNIYGHILWRCHIDTTEASRRIWRFLLPYLNQYDGAIFTSPEYVQSGLQIPLYQISPCIDPLKEKNRQYTQSEAVSVLEPLFKAHTIDADRPIVLAVSRYDIHKNQKAIVRAFKQLKTDHVFNKKKPILIMVGNIATDDPEGMKMYQVILDEIDADPDIYALLNIENNDQAVGAFMRLANCFIHVSTKEGFGLVVTEAMWQGTPVIGSHIGGIKQQVVSGTTGFLVDPHDVDRIASHIRFFLENESDRSILGRNAQEYVRQHFLLPSLIKKYLLLMRYYLEIDNKRPEFRFNDLTYNELKSALYGRSIWPFSTSEIKDRIGTIWEELEISNSSLRP